MNHPLEEPAALAKLTRLADSLIPSGPDRPSASEARVVPTVVATVIRLLPERIPLLLEAVRLVGDLGPEAAMASIREQDERSADVLCETIAGAYFMNPDVRVLIGYPGQQQSPARTSEADLEALVGVVRAAGFEPRRTEREGE